jgi:leucyl aminopeptidase
MSAALTVEIEAAAIDRARAELAIVGFGTRDRPLRGAAGRADWRLCGRLSRLIADGLLQGAAGEAALLPGGGGLRAPLLLAVGLGADASATPAAAAAFARDAVARGLRLRAQSLALALPEVAAGDAALRGRLEGVLVGAGEAVAAAGGGGLRLVLVTGRDEAARALELLRTLRPAGFPASIALRVPSAPSRRVGPAPTAGRGSLGAGPHPFK